MIAGNIPKVTQTIPYHTIPLAIYFATAGGKMHTALVWFLIIISISCSVLGLLNFWNKKNSKII